MVRLLASRVTQIIPVLIVMSLAVFALTDLLPGDPTITVLGENATPQQREVLRKEMGLDRPAPLRYLDWMGRTVSGDFGRSLRTREPVAAMIAARLPVTVQLTVLSMLVASLIGIPLGIAAALNRNSWIDLTVSVAALAGMALPFFWAGILLIRLFSIQLGWLPPSGYVPLWIDPGRNLTLMILPSLTVGGAMAGLVMRQTRSAMLQTMGQDFIRTARAKGVPEGAVVLRHGLRSALLPVVTVIGLQSGALIGGAVVTETIFSLPGLGTMIVDGIFQRDFAVIQGALLTVVLAVVVVNLATDLAYGLLDKRVRLA
jgi:peptide/nickel transport system permease protein